MAILKFRVYWEDDEAVYRDIVIKHTQTFYDFHTAILKAYEFDNKHEATFYRSNDKWQRGREISLEKYNKSYQAEPLLMADTLIGSEIQDTNQRFIYVYDFEKNWTFLIELIRISKEESSKITYPSVSRSEGFAPQQNKLQGLLGNRFTDVEEKYDFTPGEEGFGEENSADAPQEPLGDDTNEY